eukprot:s706_g3.t1
MRSQFFPRKRAFDPKLIVSDAAALRVWEDDPLVSRGKITPGYLTEMLRLQDALPEHLKRLKVPVLLLWGTGDQVVTEAGQQLVLAAAPGALSQLKRYEGGFHNLLAEPKLKDQVIEDIYSWIQEVKVGVDSSENPMEGLIIQTARVLYSALCLGFGEIQSMGNPGDDAMLSGTHPYWPSLRQPLIVSADLDDPTEARQDFCGKVFIELWSEDPEGFPMPDGCYYSEDNTNPDVVVKQLHILFSPKNHLKKNTKYMAVTNMNVLGDRAARPTFGLPLVELRADFPADGAVWVWSMDDVFTNPFGVVEKGSAFPSPVTRVPPRDTLGDPMFNVPGDPRFDTEFQNGNPPEGFKIRGTDGALIEEMKTYCIPHDEKNPAVSPSTVLACQECFTEEERLGSVWDCGNGGNGVEPDPTLSFCRSPIDLKCPQANGDRLNVPAFSFEFKARVGHPIKPQSILRLWLHPLTQWDIGVSCQVAHTQCPTVAGGVCSSPICQPESVVGGIVVGIAPWPVNTLRIILPNIMADVTNTAKMIMKIGNLPLPAGGFFPSVVTAEIMKDGGFSPFYWDMLKANAIANLNGGSAMLYKRPLILAAALVSTVGDGNTAPFRGDTGNRIYARIAFGTTFYGFGNLAQINFKLPVGYACATTQQGGSVARRVETGATMRERHGFPTKKLWKNGGLQHEKCWFHGI